MKMPKYKPAPADDSDFDAEVDELRALAKEIDRAEDSLGELMADRDKKVVETLDRWSVGQKVLGELIGMKRENVAAIVRRVRSGKGAGKAGPTGSPIRKSAATNLTRKRGSR